MAKGNLAKIKTRAELVQICAAHRSAGKKVGYTSGTFDLLHPGHVDFLEKAKSFCDLLIVGINSDASVKSYKGALRPVCNQDFRSRVAAGLESVDFVFIFEESNNNKNVELLKPHLYFKAGDYDKSELTSAPLVESYGGEVKIIPLLPGYSTSALIDRVFGAVLAGEKAVSFEMAPQSPQPAVFLDRDGTLIEHVEYLHEPEKVRLMPGAVEALKKLRQAGFRLIIVTNQPGIGLGYFAKEDFFAVTKEMLKAFGKAGVMIDKIYFCPHSQAQDCPCRKPKTAFVERAVKELNVDLSRSFVIGDMSQDIVFGKNAGCRTVLLQPPGTEADGLHDAAPHYIAPDLETAAAWITQSAT